MNHANNKSSNELITLPESFSLVFTQNDDMYYKNEDMRQLDEDVGDLESFIRDTEDLIKTELEDDILFCESELRSTFCALAELDSIKIHAVIDQKSHINIVTGSNFSGKSCRLHQVRVLIYLVHYFRTRSYAYKFFTSNILRMKSFRKLEIQLLLYLHHLKRDPELTL